MHKIKSKKLMKFIVVKNIFLLTVYEFMQLMLVIYLEESYVIVVGHPQIVHGMRNYSSNFHLLPVVGMCMSACYAELYCPSRHI